MIAGANPPTLRVLRLLLRRRLPPAGATHVVAVSGGRTQPGTGSLEIVGPVEAGCNADSLKYSAGDK